MNLRQFALNNVKRNTRSYAAYFFSSVFSVTVFFIYAAFIFHPDVASGHLSRTIQRGMVSAEVIIFAFSFLFILYSTSAFLRSRKKEFGILTLLGITKGQLNKMVFLENNVIGITSIITGTAAGSLLLKLFLMVTSQIMDLPEPMPFFLAPKAIILTVLSFLFLFELICFFTLFTVRNQSIITLIHSAKQPKKYPKSSVLLGIAAIISIGAGYSLAADSTLFEAFKRIIPILFFVIIGSYFFFTQSSIVIVRWLKKRKSSYYHSTNMLVVSDLAFKLKDNARVLFLVSILSAVAFTSSGVLFSFASGIKEEAESRMPMSIALYPASEEADHEYGVKAVNNELIKQDIPFKEKDMKLIKGQYIDSASAPLEDVSMMKESDYNTLAGWLHKPLLSLQGKQAAYIAPSPDKGYIFYNKDRMDLKLKGTGKVLDVQYIDKPIINPGRGSDLIVIDDNLYNSYVPMLQKNDYATYLGIHIPEWYSYKTQTLSAIKAAGLGEKYLISSRADQYKSGKESASLTFFIGFFVSCLFFLASASILYFRLYNDLDKDLLHYRALYRIGLTGAEMKNIITKQIGVLFFIPFSLAVVHAGFAFKMLQNMVSGSVLVPSIIIIACFLAVQAIYFLIVRTLYIQKINSVM